MKYKIITYKDSEHFQEGAAHMVEQGYSIISTFSHDYLVPGLVLKGQGIGVVYEKISNNLIETKLDRIIQLLEQSN